MKNKYRRTQTTVSFINYHFIFCPRYRRKIFDIPSVEDNFKCLVNDICGEMNIEIIAMECGRDYTYMYLNCPPTLSPSTIMKKLKDTTSKVLRNKFDELSKMPSLWTKNYFVSTAENISNETIKKYMESQRTRY